MKVSILIVLSNRGDDIYKTIESILKQTYNDLEIVIACSEDEKLKIDEYVIENRIKDRIFFAGIDEKIGVGAAYNAAEKKATGDIITFARSGSVWQSDRLLKQIAMLEKNGEWNYCTVNEGGRIFPRSEWETYKKNGMMMPDLLMEKEVDLMGVILKRGCYAEIGGFDEELSEQQEYDFLLRLSEKFCGEGLDELLVLNPVTGVSTEDYVLADIYLLIKYAEQLGQFGLKREKVIQIMKNAGYLEKMEVFFECVDYLLEDPEYARAIQEYVEEHNLVRVLEKSDEKTICGVQNCTGCAVCEGVCPVNAIQMTINREGFLVPHVDTSICIQCGKCMKYCPTQRDLGGNFRKQVCYAAQAVNELRYQGSSGGIFPLLTELAIKEGWYVSGAVYDENWEVKHIISNCAEEITKMYGSKYVQSDMRGIYARIQEILENNNTVLFSGVACQVAGLKSYLQHDYEKLYTVDVVCHGVPSPGIWQQQVKEYEKEGRICSISFRDKEYMGWNTGICLKYSDGKVIVRKKEEYLKAFLNNWNLRDSCYHCNFKGESYSDITLGDFWGIENYDESYGLDGTSFVTLNSSKGEGLYQRVREKIAKERIFPAETAVRQNPAIEHGATDNLMHKSLKQWECEKWKEAIIDTYRNLHFDIAMVCLWSNNYGNAITNYALYQTLRKKYNVLAIDTGVSHMEGRFKKFAETYSLRSSEYFPKNEWEDLQNCCDIFLVGSDQVWNSRYAEESKWGTFFQLSFVGDNKRKISYASSFGQEGLEPAADGMKCLYQRFDRISVREKFGVKVCRESYGVQAEQVLDPVFLLEQKEYDELAENAEAYEEDEFVLAYLLSPSTEKYKLCENIKNKLENFKVIYIIDSAYETKDLFRHILKFENVKVDLNVEEWVYYFKKASYVITDSFHGTCFSIIFKKKFLALLNRQTDRFKIFENMKSLKGHIVQMSPMVDSNVIFENIDYGMLDSEFAKERERSLQWLEEAVKG